MCQKNPLRMRQQFGNPEVTRVRKCGSLRNNLAMTLIADWNFAKSWQIDAKIILIVLVLNGTVNKQNCRYWSTENPHWMMEANTQYPEKSELRIIFPDDDNPNEIDRNIWFQQDGASIFFIGRIWKIVWNLEKNKVLFKYGNKKRSQDVSSDYGKHSVTY
ncbi:hypothetical protein NQ318_006672 [Aromia moschata]|uniref:Uncharacterized protein n=1 Tax=Aromia moschata TaxID=1265417 RepID=A0AAV8YT66_9CUCU|nr:hypothetical protein NQ318_006672 [Aromia moschata]